MQLAEQIKAEAKRLRIGTAQLGKFKVKVHFVIKNGMEGWYVYLDEGGYVGALQGGLIKATKATVVDPEIITKLNKALTEVAPAPAPSGRRGRAKLFDRVMTTINLDRDIKTCIDALALERSMSTSTLVNEVLSEYLSSRETSSK